METKRTEQYEKPAMKFVKLRNQEEVANTCWGYHGTDTVLYCDVPGEGYFSFQIKGGSCTLDAINIVYYDGDGKVASYTQAQYNELMSILQNAGGESGNPYKGEGTTIIPDHPGDWS